MPGAIPHLLTGLAMFGVGLIVFRNYFKGKNREKLYLLTVCLVFSIVPDFFLALYYVFSFSSFEAMLPFHVLLHSIFTPVSLIFLVLLVFVDVSRKPIWIMGFVCVLLHVAMDMIIHEGGVWL